jgi:hypothetical protein
MLIDLAPRLKKRGGILSMITWMAAAVGLFGYIIEMRGGASVSFGKSWDLDLTMSIGANCSISIDKFDGFIKPSSYFFSWWVGDVTSGLYPRIERFTFEELGIGFSIQKVPRFKCTIISEYIQTWWLFAPLGIKLVTLRRYKK